MRTHERAARSYVYVPVVAGVCRGAWGSVACATTFGLKKMGGKNERRRCCPNVGRTLSPCVTRTPHTCVHANARFVGKHRSLREGWDGGRARRVSPVHRRRPPAERRVAAGNRATAQRARGLACRRRCETLFLRAAVNICARVVSSESGGDGITYIRQVRVLERSESLTLWHLRLITGVCGLGGLTRAVSEYCAR